jgi:hypothetical protein
MEQDLDILLLTHNLTSPYVALVLNFDWYPITYAITVDEFKQIMSYFHKYGTRQYPFIGVHVLLVQPFHVPNVVVVVVVVVDLVMPEVMSLGIGWCYTVTPQ